MALQITIEQFQALAIAELQKAGFPNKVVGVEISLTKCNPKPRYRMYLLQDDFSELPKASMLVDSRTSPFKAIYKLVAVLKSLKVNAIEVDAAPLN